ncbi:hypothetical protein ACF1A9_20145 [Streptomyces sp. NPDC014872]
MCSPTIIDYKVHRLPDVLSLSASTAHSRCWQELPENRAASGAPSLRRQW